MQVHYEGKGPGVKVPVDVPVKFGFGTGGSKTTRVVVLHATTVGAAILHIVANVVF